MQLFLISNRCHKVSYDTSRCHLPQTNLNLILIKLLNVQLKIELSNMVFETWHAQEVQLEELWGLIFLFEIAELDDGEHGLFFVLSYKDAVPIGASNDFTFIGKDELAE